MSKGNINKYLDKITRAEDWISDKIDVWENIYKLYMGIKKQGMRGRSNLHIPVTFISVNTVATRLIYSLFNTPPYVRVLPMNSMAIEESKFAEKLLNYYLGQKEHFHKYYMYVVNELLYDIGAMKIIPYKNGKYLSFKLEVVNPWDLFFDVDAPSLEDMTFVGHRKEVHISYIKGKIKKGEFKRVDVKKLTGGAEDSGYNVYERQEPSPLPKNPDYVELVEIIDVVEKKRIVLGNRRAILLEEDFTDPLPYVLMNCYPIPGRLKGLSDGELIRDLQKEINAKRNQRLDNVNRILNQMFFVKIGSIQNLERLANPVPGGVIFGTEKPEPLVVPDLTSNLILEEERPFRDIERALGVYDIVRGETSRKRESATEVLTASQNANMRFWLKTRFLETGFILELADKMLRFLVKYGGKMVVKMRSNEFREITPRDINPDNLMFEAVASSQVENTQIRRNQVILLFTQLLKMFPELVNKQGMAEYLVDLFDIKEKDKILNIMEEEQTLTEKQHALSLADILRNATNLNPPGMQGIPMPPITKIGGEGE